MGVGTATKGGSAQRLPFGPVGSGVLWFVAKLDKELNTFFVKLRYKPLSKRD